jgi:hypothetical protein
MYMTTDLNGINTAVCAINKKGDAGAVLSDCGTYLYNLWRSWDEEKNWLIWIMLHPSGADGTEDDATIRRCEAYAKVWGCGGISVYNLFAFRATNPQELRTASDPVGPLNDHYLREIPNDRFVACAWGAAANLFPERVQAVKQIIGGKLLIHLGMAGGQPRHPLDSEQALPVSPWAQECSRYINPRVF